VIGFDFKFVDTSKLVIDRAKDATFKNLGHTVATIRKDAQASIDISAEPSQPGTPPNTRDGKLPRAITFDVDKASDIAVVGPRASVVGQAGAAHEHGETLGETDFPERDFMEPALEKNLSRFGESFAGSI